MRRGTARRTGCCSRALLILAALVPLGLAQETRESRPTSDPSSWNDEAIRIADLGRIDEAITLLERARSARPGDDVFVVNLSRMIARRGQRAFTDGNLVAAEADLLRALELAPKEGATRVQLSIVLRSGGDLARARRAVERAIQDAPGLHSAFEELGHVAYEEDELAAALEALDVALKLDGGKSQALKEFREKVHREWEVEKAFFRTERGTFVVKYDDETFKHVGDAVLDFLDDAEQHARKTLGHAPTRRVSLVLYTRGDFTAATGAHQWAGGLFDGKIRLPVRNFAETRRVISATIAHEYTHLVVRDLSRRCPVWLNEGLAQLAENRPAASALPVLRGARELKRIADLPSSWVSIKDGSEVAVFYAQGLSFTDFLVRRFGYPAIRDLLGKLDGKLPFPAAFSEVTGRSLDEVEDAWRAEIR